jgi:ribulose-phosphate 3-epimerase
MSSVPQIVFLWAAVFIVHVNVVVASSPNKKDRKQPRRKLVVGVDGGTESIRACLFDAHNGEIVGKSCASPYPTHYPNAGWAEQSPLDWYDRLGDSVRGALQSLEGHEDEVELCAICLDTTCCSVVFLDNAYQPLRPALLWMDARSAPQTKEILQKCKGNPALDINCDGQGPLSAEWMTPKCLWVYQNERRNVWNKAKTVCEYQDYLNYQLTGCMVASSCNAASRWHWDGEECIEQGGTAKHPGRPLSMYKTLGISELAEKLPQQCLPMGALVGNGLTRRAAKHLNLPEGLPVVQGGPDAFVGMLGLGCIHPGQLCLITGSSHLHCVVTSKPSTAPGTWGAYRGAPLPGLYFAEGGQSSTGSILRWAKQKLFEGERSENSLTYEELDKAAAKVAPGCDGLVALETFQGSRTPVTDPLARGALVGLTLSHTRSHVWRALMEGVCFGTRSCVEGLAKAGHVADEIVIAGGAARSPLWLQMHADITGLPVVVCENGDAPLLGCAVLASVGIGIHRDFGAAVKAMVRPSRRVLPDSKTKRSYTDLYKQVYSKLGEAARPISHSIADIRGGTDSTASFSSPKKRGVVVSPSLLAADWSEMRAEVERCITAKASRLHVDVFDGVFLDSPYALTFGPQMVQAIRQSCSNAVRKCGSNEPAVLDLHMCVDRPLRYVKAMAEAGGDRLIFQWEAILTGSGEFSGEMSELERAKHLAEAVAASGMSCGVSINPGTNVESIYPLLETGLIDLVDILAVEPGFGGQAFQHRALQKVMDLRKWREQSGLQFDILVDGGINQQTAASVLEAGADILVAGTFLFKHPRGLSAALLELTARP